MKYNNCAKAIVKLKLAQYRRWKVFEADQVYHSFSALIDKQTDGILQQIIVKVLIDVVQHKNVEISQF